MDHQGLKYLLDKEWNIEYCLTVDNERSTKAIAILRRKVRVIPKITGLISNIE